MDAQVQRIIIFLLCLEIKKNIAECPKVTGMAGLETAVVVVVVVVVVVAQCS